ncbi:MAG: peptide chain release factor N(5)-glutamine methyltransferase [Candidatus Hydrogenedentota bacterium]|nr:MAG: peptide chain release factor N(5)-glutamine methyltransferase [Candidatus Hydrogenedentota bacterium]
MERGKQELEAPFRTVAEAVEWGARHLREGTRCEVRGEPVPGTEDLFRREARWLLEAAAVSAGRDPTFLRLPELTQRVAAVFRSSIARRARGEPLAYVLGTANFRGLDLEVTPDVLIPRPETEELVSIALEFLESVRTPRILDQGTGCGAIAIALAVERPDARITGIDISPSALAIAERNARRHGVTKRVRFIEADLFPQEAESFDLIVGNLPYVSDTEELPSEVELWEPPGALRGGAKGTEIICRALARTGEFLTKNGRFLYEIGEGQHKIFGPRYSYRRDAAGRIRFLWGGCG